MEPKPFRVQPVLDDENRFFWTSGEDGRLRFLRCQSCGYYLHPPLPRCPECGGRALEPEPVSGTAEVHSFTINHQSWDGSTEPYAIALVTIPEQQGLRLTTNIVGCPLDDIHIGMPVQVTFEQHDLVWFPLFEPFDAEAELRRRASGADLAVGAQSGSGGGGAAPSRAGGSAGGSAPRAPRRGRDAS